jgi:membrane fusion protein, multidrug efflux system
MSMDRTKDRPARTRGVLAVAGAALLALAVQGCGGDAQADGQTAEAPYERVINVEVRELATRPFTETTRITGTVQANQDVEVSAEEAGVIRELPVEQGRAVRAGDPIARIDDRSLRAQVREAEARAQLARETWERRRRLFEVDGVGSELAYLEARYQAEQAEAQLEALQERLERTVVRAPLPGILETRLVEVGTMVSPGVPVARIVQVDPVKIAGGVPERFAREIRRGSEARVTFDVLRGEVFDGTLSYVGATVNPRNRTFPVELVLRNPGEVIKPEMVANMEITRRVLDDVIVVPQEAVVRVEEGFVAFVMGERDGREVAELRSLVLGGAQRNLVVVEEGLEAGDRLIVVGQNQVADGDRVRVVGGSGDSDD